MKIKTKTSAAFEMDFISLDKFIDLISVSETKERKIVQFDTLITYGGYVEFDDKDAATYQRRTASLVSNKEGLKNSLINQAKIHDKFNTGFQELMEDITVESVTHYGIPDYLVNIGPRMWMATNPNDFRIFENKDTGKKALACVAQGRLIINNVLKISEKEAQIVAQKYMKENDEV